MPTIEENRAKIDEHIHYMMTNFTPEQRESAMSELLSRLQEIGKEYGYGPEAIETTAQAQADKEV